VLPGALGSLLRSTAGAPVTWLGLWIIPGIVVMVLPPRIGGALGPYLPGEAGSTNAEVPGPGEAAAWADLAVFAAYAVVISVAALIALRRRDA
jgi:ABC-2 type transport system permease protein